MNVLICAFLIDSFRIEKNPNNLSWIASPTWRIYLHRIDDNPVIHTPLSRLLIYSPSEPNHTVFT